MAMTRSVVTAMARLAAGAPGGSGRGAPARLGRCVAAAATAARAVAGAACGRGPRARRLLAAAARTAATRPLLGSPRKSRRPSVGLVTKATAPSAIACSVVAAPLAVRVEHITTGVGRSTMILRRKLMPSMRGISTSSTTTSGQRAAILGQANSGSLAVAITSMPAAVSRSARCLRTTAESSTTTAVMARPAGLSNRGIGRALSQKKRALLAAAGPGRALASSRRGSAAVPAPRRMPTSPVARVRVTVRGTSSPTSTPSSAKP